LEVENIQAIDAIQDYFPDYDFNFTDGPQNMEIVVGHRRGFF